MEENIRENTKKVVVQIVDQIFKFLNFCQANLEMLVGTAFGVCCLLLGRQVAKILERHFLNAEDNLVMEKMKNLCHSIQEKIEGQKFITERMSSGGDFIPKVPPLIYRGQGVPTHIFQELLILKKEILLKNLIKFEEKDEKETLKLIEEFEYFAGRCSYNKIISDHYNKSNRSTDYINIAKKLGLVNDGIFDKIKLKIFGIEKDVFIKAYLSKIAAIIVEEMNASASRKNESLPFANGQEFSCGEIMEKLEELIKVGNYSSENQRYWKYLLCDKYINSKEMIKHSKDRMNPFFVIKATKILAPVVAICAGFAAKKAFGLYTNKGGASR